MVTSSKTTSTVKENTDGLMEESTEVNGLTIRWKAKEPSPGVMADDMLVCTRMIKSMDKVPSNGQMVVSTLASGAKASSTEKENTSRKERAGKESGRWVRESSGSRKKLSEVK